MLENITVGEVGAVIAFIAAFVGGVVYLKDALRKILADVVKEELKPISKQVDEMQKKIDRVDMESCKNFLVRCLVDFENGDTISETEYERFWEQYQHYTESGHNSYIKNKVEQLKKDGKL